MVSEPPEVVAPDEEAVNPAGKSEAGSSTDASSVPVSWPAAAGSGVIDAVGSGPVVAVGAVAADVADGECDCGVAYGVPLVEHPVTAASVPAATASTASPGRRRGRRRNRRATERSRLADDDTGDDTGLPTLIRTRTLTTYPSLSALGFTDREPEAAHRVPAAEFGSPDGHATGPVGKLAADRGWRAARRPE